MALLDVSRLLTDRGDLWNKIRGAVVNAAAAIYTEAPETVNHANRLTWAQDVLLNGLVDEKSTELYRLAMTNGDIVAAGNATEDATVNYIVAFFLDTVARG